MSELKATTVYDAYWKANSVGEGTGILVYLKSEADRVISELIEKNKRLASKDKIMASETIKDLLKQLRHNKFERCLAMARWCKMSARENDTRMCLPMKCKLTRHEEYLYFIGYYHKWQKRWLELAEKFKEAK